MVDVGDEGGVVLMLTTKVLVCGSEGNGSIVLLEMVRGNRFDGVGALATVMT